MTQTELNFQYFFISTFFYFSFYFPCISHSGSFPKGVKGKCSFVSIVLLWEIPNNFSCCLFYFLQRKQKFQSPRKRAAFHILLGKSGKGKVEKSQRNGLFTFFSSSWCYQLHSANVISGIQWAGLHHTTLDPQLRH